MQVNQTNEEHFICNNCAFYIFVTSGVWLYQFLCDETLFGHTNVCISFFLWEVLVLSSETCGHRDIISLTIWYIRQWNVTQYDIVRAGEKYVLKILKSPPGNEIDTLKLRSKKLCSGSNIVSSSCRNITLPTSTTYHCSSQCWLNVGPLSTTLAQHLASIGPMSRVSWEYHGRIHTPWIIVIIYLAETGHALSSSPRPWIDVFALPEKFSMAVTESDLDPKVRKISIFFYWLCDLWAEHAGMEQQCYWF